MKDQLKRFRASWFLYFRSKEARDLLAGDYKESQLFDDSLSVSVPVGQSWRVDSHSTGCAIRYSRMDQGETNRVRIVEQVPQEPRDDPRTEALCRFGRNAGNLPTLQQIYR